MRWILIAIFSLGISLGISAQADDGGVNSSAFNWSNSNWTFRYFQVGGNGHEELKRGGAPYSSYNYFYVKKYLDYTRSFRFAMPFRLETPGYDFFDQYQKSFRLTREDWFVGYIDRELFLLPWGVSTYSEFRYYLPNGESAAQEGRIGRLRADFILKKKVAHRLYLQSWVKFNYFLQSNAVTEKSFIGDNGERVTYLDATKESRIDLPLDLIYISPGNVSYRLGGGVERTSYFRGSNQLQDPSLGANTVERLKGGEDIRVRFGPGVAFSLANQLRLQLNVDYSYLTTSRKSYTETDVVDVQNDNSIDYALFVWAGFRDFF